MLSNAPVRRSCEPRTRTWPPCWCPSNCRRCHAYPLMPWLPEATACMCASVSQAVVHLAFDACPRGLRSPLRHQTTDFLSKQPFLVVASLCCFAAIVFLLYHALPQRSRPNTCRPDLVHYDDVPFWRPPSCRRGLGNRLRGWNQLTRHVMWWP